MPCTMYIRPHTKYNFTEDPDCVHEMLGHIPHLFIPSWSRLYRAFGRTARRLAERGDDGAMERLILMYFAVVEKGLVRTGPGDAVKAIGASVISGAGELRYAVAHPERHLPLEAEAVMKYGSTDEDGFMDRYFVGESVEGMADFVISWVDQL
uniref:phenylalanine 4-monooxygenase n=1 Tax=Zooxanthella nutricula TaxID=1333877 RepID=A0A7S2QEG6_9DINO|mmetsp:Transcript_87653/g.268228  ORF Transcript_87653/g.268228 Transcript_87653/m.268228 type:complete len:152 (+) Transcript_87653:85-540(+)